MLPQELLATEPRDFLDRLVTFLGDSTISRYATLHPTNAVWENVRGGSSRSVETPGISATATSSQTCRPPWLSRATATG
jgi:hypothetical protein